MLAHAYTDALYEHVSGLKMEEKEKCMILALLLVADALFSISFKMSKRED